MAIFVTPYAKRARNAARIRERYRADPVFRLEWLNAKRRREGMPLLTSLEGVSRKATANRRPRDDKGRFL